MNTLCPRVVRPVAKPPRTEPRLLVGVLLAVKGFSKIGKLGADLGPLDGDHGLKLSAAFLVCLHLLPPCKTSQID